MTFLNACCTFHDCFTRAINEGNWILCTHKYFQKMAVEISLDKTLNLSQSLPASSYGGFEPFLKTTLRTERIEAHDSDRWGSRRLEHVVKIYFGIRF